ncbi:MAG: transposase [Maricaulaceae bacterium]
MRSLIEADEGLAFALTPILETRGALYVHYREMDKRVKRVAAQDPVCNLLMTTPGVGAMTALHFKAAVDDPTRFTLSRTVAAHFDLTPRRFQSGEMDNPGRISRARDTEIRAALYTAANSLLTRTKQMSPLKAWGLRLVRRRSRTRGTVAVARKLAVILHRMWIDGTPYRWSDVEVVK